MFHINHLILEQILKCSYNDKRIWITIKTETPGIFRN